MDFLLNIPLNTGVVIGFVLVLLLLLYGLYKNNTDEKCPWEWWHLVSDRQGKGSLTRVLQLLGGITATFVIVYQTLNTTVTTELFAVYLAALGVSEGFSKWLQHRYSGSEQSKGDNGSG